MLESRASWTVRSVLGCPLSALRRTRVVNEACVCCNTGQRKLNRGLRGEVLDDCTGEERQGVCQKVERRARTCNERTHKGWSRSPGTGPPQSVGQQEAVRRARLGPSQLSRDKRTHQQARAAQQHSERLQVVVGDLGGSDGGGGQLRGERVACSEGAGHPVSPKSETDCDSAI